MGGGTEFDDFVYWFKPLTERQTADEDANDDFPQAKTRQILHSPKDEFLIKPKVLTTDVNPRGRKIMRNLAVIYKFGKSTAVIAISALT